MHDEHDTSQRSHASRRAVLAAAGTLSVGLLAGCSGDGSSTEDGERSEGGNAQAEVGWRTVEMTDVRSGETFTVESFEKPVVLETFAVWCPKCDQQQRQLAGLDDSVAVVSVNTDPNENAEAVRQHAEDNGFDWRYVVASTTLTDSLIEAFGTTVTNAPSTPVIVACPGGGATFTSGEIRSPAELLDTAAEC
jgi:thiol-disulfide isomerase/thioredoxin